MTSYVWLPVGGQFRANLQTSGDQVQPAIASSPDGSGFLIGWPNIDSPHSPTVGRLANGEGQPTPQPWGFSLFGESSIAGLPGGRYVAVSTDRQSDSHGDLRFSLLEADGSKAIMYQLVDPSTVASADSAPDVATLADGGFVFTWTRELGGGNTDIHAAIRNADGSVRAADFVVNASSRSTTHSAVAGLAGGGFVTVWQESATPGGHTEVRFRLFDGDGAPRNGTNVTGVLIDDVGTVNKEIDVLGLPDGGFAVAYTDDGWGSGNDITLRIFSADGSARSDFIRVNSAALGGTVAGDQDKPALALISQQHFAVGWSSGDQFYLQAFDFAGDPVAANKPIDSNAVEGELAGLADGKLAYAFESLLSDGSGTSIRSGVWQLKRTILGDQSSEVIIGVDDSLPQTLMGLEGNDWLAAGAAPDTIIGGPGNDTAVYSMAPAGVIASLINPAGNTGYAKGDEYYSLENLAGSPFNDRLVGDGAHNKLLGALGDDKLYGGGGDDILDGGSGEDTAWYGFDLGQHRIQDFHRWIVVTGASGTDRLLHVEKFEFADATLAVVDDGNALFDALYYYSGNTDVFFAGANALDHFTANGWHEGRDPNAFFDTSGYLAVNTDVAAAGSNPLDHYHQTGWKEARDPSADFDTTLYLLRNPDVAAAGVDPLEHFLRFGFSEGRSAYAAIGQNIVSGFDAQYYLFHNPDVAAAGVDPLQHFNAHGWHEGRNPNAWFDTAGYLAHYADIAAAGVNPLDHYMAFGWKEGRDPSASFDTLGYLAANADVAAAGVNPLGHYLGFGVYEGRAAVNDGLWHA
jgi:Ca2+-binding RTX toxin-like protein